MSHVEHDKWEKKREKETLGVVLKIEQNSKMVDLFPW